MQLYSECMHCIVDHHWELVKDQPDEARRAAFMREVCRAVAEADPAQAAPVPTARLQKLYASMFTADNDYPRLKRKYNEMLLAWLPRLRAAVEAAKDPLQLAVWMAMVGNYIDFGVMRQIDDARLQALLETPEAGAVNADELERLRGEVRAARRLTYVCDNCGEIVLDMLLMEQLRRLQPEIEITALVRGENVLNDATVEDARAVGMDALAALVGNGTNIGGTQFETLSEAARAALLGADVIVSKGLGNFETLTGIALNIYYLFLAKCPFYEKWFGMRHMSGQLVNERRFARP
ncbi:MAG TPA: DUF89 family protein [Candidatus Pullichristensenella avicola]|nr:DUF89 family protein [Candidatus Pullichristensenella avicola]